jgi:hypothetical protein
VGFLLVLFCALSAEKKFVMVGCQSVSSTTSTSGGTVLDTFRAGDWAAVAVRGRLVRAGVLLSGWSFFLREVLRWGVAYIQSVRIVAGAGVIRGENVYAPSPFSCGGLDWW